MTEPNHPQRERFEQLLVDRATIGLDESKSQELDRLAIELGIPADDSVDLAAAAIDSLVAIEELEPLPEHLRQAVVASAGNAIGQSQDSASSSATASEIANPAIERPVAASPRSQLTLRDMFSLLAVAACLIFAAFVWFSQPKIDSVLPIAQQRIELLESKPLDLVQVSWKRMQKDSPNAIGDVVWSSSQQQGYMTFQGLPRNDPSVEQYQLWIFDKNRNDKYPVDGGVFDIHNANLDSVVAIDPKIKIDEATMFAITIERPGGVVVSDRSRLPLLAKVGE